MFARPLPHSKAVWGGLILGAAALDWWADQGDPDADTLTESIRGLFHTEHPAGKAAFTLALAVGTNWLHAHICKPV